VLPLNQFIQTAPVLAFRAPWLVALLFPFTFSYFEHKVFASLSTPDPVQFFSAHMAPSIPETFSLRIYFSACSRYHVHFRLYICFVSPPADLLDLMSGILFSSLSYERPDGRLRNSPLTPPTSFAPLPRFRCFTRLFVFFSSIKAYTLALFSPPPPSILQLECR